MIKHYCDGCGREITPPRRPATFAQQVENGNEIKAQVIVAVDGTWNGGDVCIGCIRRTVNIGTLVAES